MPARILIRTHHQAQFDTVKAQAQAGSISGVVVALEVFDDPSRRLYLSLATDDLPSFVSKVLEASAWAIEARIAAYSASESFEDNPSSFAAGAAWND